MNNPLVTISIPIYNCEKHILKCLQSVALQDYKNLEVLLVDDCGQDSSMALVEDFIPQNSHLNWRVLRNKENSGLSVVRNVGIDHAQGKYIFFLDSDDEITPNCISKMVEVAEKEQVQMVCGNVNTIRLETKEELDVFKLQFKNRKLLGNDAVFNAYIDGKFPVPSWNKLILVSFLREHQLYFKKGLYAQDDLQTFITILMLESVYFLEESTYLYYLHQDSVIHNRNQKHFNNWNTIISEIHMIYTKEKDPLKKNKLKKFIIRYKDEKLLMNWKAQKNKEMWMINYRYFKKIFSLEITDFSSFHFTFSEKRKAIIQNLPDEIGYRVFRKRYGG